MEHRCTERTSSELKILIYKHNHPVAIGRIKNGSHSGVFVETDFVDVDCEHQLRFEILLNKNTLTKLQRIEMDAIVIHKTNKGFGAEVDFSSTAHANTFLELLQRTAVSHSEEAIYAKVANN